MKKEPKARRLFVPLTVTYRFGDDEFVRQEFTEEQQIELLKMVAEVSPWRQAIARIEGRQGGKKGGKKGGTKGGRPGKKPLNADLAVAYELYVDVCAYDGENEHRARAELVKDLADSCDVTKEAARGWLRRAGIG